MKTAIVYYSQHHGNTKKLIDAIAAKYEVDLIDAAQTSLKGPKVSRPGQPNSPRMRADFFFTISAMDLVYPSFLAP